MGEIQTDFGPSLLEERQRAREQRPSATPLGILPQVRLDDGQIGALWTIAECDLTPVRDRLVTSGAMTRGWADEAVFEFRRYLGLRVVLREPVTMVSRDMDEVWHACLIFTRLYADLCERAFGSFVHHDPGTEPNPDRQGAWMEFEDAYRSLYGEVGPLWELRRPPG